LRESAAFPSAGALAGGRIIGRRASLVSTPSAPSFPRVQRQPRIERGSHAGYPKRRPTERTRHLTFKQVRNLVNAVAFSNAHGAPLTARLTVLWSHFAGFREDNLGHLTTTFFDRMSKWLTRHNVVLRAVWTRERGEQKGHHLHALLNVPDRLITDLESYLRRTFEISARGVLFRRRCGTLRQQIGFLRYVCKSLDHRAFVYHGFETINVGDALGIQHVGTDGPIATKRAGWTENLGPTARRRAGWRELRHLEELAITLNPDAAANAR
jgi:hypothetical protein